MASLITKASGLIDIKALLHRKAYWFRLGRVTKKEALTFKRFLEDLIDARKEDIPPDRSTVKWIQQLPARHRDKLASMGLVESIEDENARTLKGLLDVCLNRKARNCSGTSVQVYKQTVANLLTFFGDVALSKITEDGVGEFKTWLETEANQTTGKGLSPVTVATRLKTARQFMGVALKKRLINENPFSYLTGFDVKVNETRQHYVPRDIVERLIEDATCTEWRLLLALWRFAGLRQMEPFELKWGDIAWSRGRMTVTATKQTKSHKIRRVIPIWPEVLPWLEKQFEEAPEGTTDVIFRRRYSYDTDRVSRNSGSSLYARLERQLIRSGTIPWPRLIQSLRSSGETDAERSGKFRQWEVAYWWNHSKDVQESHYLTVTDDAFDTAIGAHSEKPEKCTTKCTSKGLVVTGNARKQDA